MHTMGRKVCSLLVLSQRINTSSRFSWSIRRQGLVMHCTLQSSPLFLSLFTKLKSPLPFFRHIRKDFEEGGDYKRAKHIHCVKKFKVVIKYAATFPLSPIIYASEGIETGNTQNTVRILNIILRHQQAKRFLY